MYDDIKICPICNNDTLEEGEFCDVGVGYVKCGPDHCYFCDYIEPSSHHPFDLGFSHYIKCWELQIYPHAPEAKSIRGEVNEKYLPYFKTKYEEAFGHCYHACLELTEKFPELKIVQGTVHSDMGLRDHYWCLDENNIIVDPTACQFQMIAYLSGRCVAREKLIEQLQYTNNFF